MTLHPLVQNWLRARGLDPKVVESLPIVPGSGYNLGFELPDGSVHWRSSLANKEYRWEGRQKKMPRRWWNGESIKDPNQDVYITEGEFDTIAMVQVGFKQSVAHIDGAPNIKKPDDHDGDTQHADLDPASQCGAIATHAPALIEGDGRIVLMLDGDAPGEILKERYKKWLRDMGLGFRVYEVEYPDGCKDANDVLMTHGEQALIELARNASQTWRDDAALWCMASDGPTREPNRTADTGIRDMDTMFQFEIGALSVWAGQPGCGKTTLMNSMVFALMDQGLRVGMASFEQPYDKFKISIARLLNGGLDTVWLEPDVLDGLKEQAARWMDGKLWWLKKEPIITDNTETLEWFEEQMMYAIDVLKVDVIVLDNWGNLSHIHTGDETHIYIDRRLMKFQRLATLKRKHIAVLHHMRKSTNRILTMDDIAGSTGWASKPDYVIGLSRPGWKFENPDDAPLVFEVWKSREADIAKHQGVAYLKLNKNTGQYRRIQAPPELQEQPKRKEKDH